MYEIALMELGDEKRWLEIKDMNRERYPHMGYGSYFPQGAQVRLPADSVAGVGVGVGVGVGAFGN